MTENRSDADPLDLAEGEPAVADGADPLFGAYSVLSPGVVIVLDGRPVSAPPDD